MWPLLRDSQHDLAARVPVRDLRQRLARLIQRQHLDLGAQPARIDEAAQCFQPLPVDVGGERLAGDAALKLGGRTLQNDEDRPAAVADRADGLIAGLAASAVQQNASPVPRVTIGPGLRTSDLCPGVPRAGMPATEGC